MKRSLNIIISALLLIGSTYTLCTDGCMKCGTSQNCLLCDFTSGYIQSNGDCLKSQQSKCKILSQTGRCLSCLDNYYVDTISGFCVQVPKSSMIPNCQIYSNLVGCQKCAKNYYQESGKCFAITQKVPGCLVQGKDICLECDKGKILHPTRERCIEDPNENYCAIYGYLKCNQCKRGYFLNPNYFFRYLFDNDQIIDFTKARDYLLAAFDDRIDRNIAAPCQPISIQNCVEYDSFDSCVKCERFYFLNKNKKCEFFPYPVIPNCSIYSNYNECIKCNQGFYLKGKQECKAVIKIEKCKIYSQTAAVVLCTECEQGFYVSGNVCRERHQTVDKCSVYSTNNDNCKECEKGFGLASNFLSCLGLVDNCAVHNFTQTQGTKFPCVTCKDTFFLSQTQSCEAGSIPNCLTYTDQNTCTVCANTYYLEGNECKLHSTINDCEIYSNQFQNICTQCNNFSLLAVQKVGCEKIINPILNCIAYSSPTVCTTCEDRYFLNTNLCELIPPEEKCIRKNPNEECILCESFYLLKNGACVKPYEYETRNCIKVKNDGVSNTFQCEQCQIDTAPFYHYYSTMCVKPEERFQTNEIQNCLAYEQDENAQETCFQCEEGYFLSTDNTQCLSTCPDYYELDIHTEDELNDGEAVKSRKYIRHQCKQNNPAKGCEILVTPNNHGSFKECVKCKSGYDRFYKVQGQNTSNNNLVSYNPETVNKNTLTKTLGVQYLSFDCEIIAQNTVYKTTGTTTKPANCEVFESDNNQLRCKRCKFGYTGVVDENDKLNLRCDKLIRGCDVLSYYGGLIQDYDKNKELLHEDFSLLNCHKCLSKNQIPFLFLKNGSLQPFEITYEDQMASDDGLKDGEWIQCLEPTPKSFRMNKQTFTRTFPKNCAVGKFLVDQQKSYKFFSTDNSLQCIFCKPGFKAQRDDNDIITKCLKIEHCDNKYETKWFNNCAKCLPGFNWYYNDSEQDERKVQFDVCVPSQDENCWISNTNPIKDFPTFYEKKHKNCLLCKRGFILNEDGVCDKIDLPNCQEGQTFGQIPMLYNNRNSLFVIKDLISKNLGCQRCQDGYVGYQPDLFDVEEIVCAKSDYVKLRDFGPKTNYVNNCQNYGNDGQVIICNQCDYGYILSTNNRYCIRQQVYPNCLHVDANGKKCAECRDRYVLVEGFCEPPKITHCRNYVLGQKYQKCDDCEDTYMLVNNHCVKGPVQHCQRYNNNQKCTSCFEWYQILNIEAGNQYCIPIPKDFNCRTFQDISMTNGELRCEECSAEYALTEESLKVNASFCINLIPIENCLTYDNNTLLTDSTLKCTSCKETHYLFDNQCKQRKVQTASCNVYSPTNDYCDKCNDGFYLTNNKVCEAFPIGIYGCEVYSDSVTCTSCQKYMFLNGNVCTLIEPKDRIPKCYYYNSLNSCKKCEFSYYLNDEGVCVPAKAQNCISYKSITECSVCPENFGFMEDLTTGFINCVYISTPNCELAENVFPFNCIRCRKFFYEDEGSCLPMETFIPYCQEYEFRDRCKMCEEDYILSFDHKKCITPEESGLELFDTCANNEQTQVPFCQGCKFGYQFYKGQCIVCKVHTLEKGCLYCLGIDQEQCIVCKPGYYHDNNKNCVQNGAAPTFLPVTNDTTTNTTTTDTTTTDTTTTDTTTTDTTTTDTTTTDTTTTETNADQAN